MHDQALKEAVISEFLREHPQTSQAGQDHPALQDIDAIAWSQIPGCPAAIPAVIRGLLTPAGKESLRVLGIVLTDDIFHLNPAMPVALPFLIGLAADPHTCARDGLVDLLVLTAELSLPVESEDDRFITLFGTDDAHPERAGCKAAFAEHADALLALLEDDSLTDVLTPDDRSALRAAITTS